MCAHVPEHTHALVPTYYMHTHICNLKNKNMGSESLLQGLLCAQALRDGLQPLYTRVPTMQAFHLCCRALKAPSPKSLPALCFRLGFLMWALHGPCCKTGESRTVLSSAARRYATPGGIHTADIPHYLQLLAASRFLTKCVRGDGIFFF